MKPVVGCDRPGWPDLGRVVTEDIEMFARKDAFLSIGRGALLAAVAALALTAIEPSAARAGSAIPEQGVSTRHAVTDFSARRRYHHGDRYETAIYRHLDGADEAARRHAYWEAFNAYYGGGAVYDDHGPFYAEFGGYGSNVPPYLWGPSPYAWR
jgi:hypothetical protein